MRIPLDLPYIFGEGKGVRMRSPPGHLPPPRSGQKYVNFKLPQIRLYRGSFQVI